MRTTLTVKALPPRLADRPSARLDGTPQATRVRDGDAHAALALAGGWPGDVRALTAELGADAAGPVTVVEIRYTFDPTAGPPT